jgi:hypothetical protein
LIFFHPGKNAMLTHPMLNIRIPFTNYDIIADFLNLAFCSEHCISIKHRILATVNINKNFNSDSLCAFKVLNDRNITGADPGFQVRGGALKKIASSGGGRENFCGISCE